MFAAAVYANTASKLKFYSNCPWLSKKGYNVRAIVVGTFIASSSHCAFIGHCLKTHSSVFTFLALSPDRFTSYVVNQLYSRQSTVGEAYCVFRILFINYCYLPQFKYYYFNSNGLLTLLGRCYCIHSTSAFLCVDPLCCSQLSSALSTC
jgi:hypothetical protein